MSYQNENFIPIENRSELIAGTKFRLGITSTDTEKYTGME